MMKNGEISLKQLRREFEEYFNKTKSWYKYPGQLFGMAFYITRHNLGIRLEDLFSKKVSLDEYGDILYTKFKEMNSKNPYGRMSAYKDVMKNLLEFVEYKDYKKIVII